MLKKKQMGKNHKHKTRKVSGMDHFLCFFFVEIYFLSAIHAGWILKIKLIFYWIMIESDWIGSDWIRSGPDQIGSDRIGSERWTGCYSLLVQRSTNRRCPLAGAEPTKKSESQSQSESE